MAAILVFNRKWIFFRLPLCLNLKILFVPSFMLVPSHRTIFEQSLAAIYCKNINAHSGFYSDSVLSNIATLKQIHRK